MSTENNALSGIAIIIGQYLAAYQPASIEDKSPIVKTTEEIINDLSDMADFTHNQIAEAMLQLGYRPMFQRNGRHGWAMTIRQEEDAPHARNPVDDIPWE